LPLAGTIDVLVREPADCPAQAPLLAEQWGRLAEEPPTNLDEWTRARLGRLVAWEARTVELADGGGQHAGHQRHIPIVRHHVSNV
jgi:hypothetical protein